MTARVSVLARVPGQARESGIGAVELELPTERMRLEELVRRAVEEQVRTLTVRRKLAVLEIRERMQRQYGPADDRREPVLRVATLDVEMEIERALAACREGRCVVMVDGAPTTDLEAQVVIGPETRVQFLRLVPLQGG